VGGVTSRQRLAELMMPWGGHIGGGLGWALTHQLGSTISYDNCLAMSPWAGLLIGLFGLALAGGGAFFSWKVWRRGAAGAGGRHFVALLGLLMAGLLALPIIWQTIAVLIIPRCFG
jgi:hypothetical protein